jgi:hypothetical protein
MRNANEKGQRTAAEMILSGAFRKDHNMQMFNLKV